MVLIIIHVLTPGDTIYKLSQKYNLPIEKIIADNAISDVTNLPIGQSIVISQNNLTYTVQKGDTLYKISQNYAISVNQILAANPSITNPDVIYVGQTLTIPTNSESKLREISVNGYAFPGTTSQVLSNILPSLTYISIFSYQLQDDGSLDSIYDSRVINQAIDAQVAPIMVITNTRTGKGFDSDLAHLVLTNSVAQQNLINNMLNILKSKKYEGVNIDFEYIYQYDKDSYTQFSKNLASVLHPLGYILSTSLAPKTSENQSGILYEAHDYKAQGEIVDQIILMTYEWGYIYGPAAPVSPINEVEKVLQYATSVIPSNKIMMGLPNYGYDWTLPFIKGTAATPLTNLQAVKLASSVGSSIKYDTKTQTPFFEYVDDNGKNHIVWFDDARSMKAKLELIDKYNLLGVSYWNINTYFPQNWVVLNSLYDVTKI